MLLHLFAALVAASTAVLIFAGGLVTSTGSGLSVPDWPTTYGWFMLTFPLDKMVGGIFYEHSHRLIASGVGLLIVVLAVWLWKPSPGAGCGALDTSPWRRSSPRGFSAASRCCGFCRMRSRSRTPASHSSSSA